MVAHAKEKTELPPRFTPLEYLEREGKAETKSEYYDGIIVGMAGASPEHNTIVSNLHGEIYAQLRGKDCRPFTNDMRVRVEKCNRYYYPDLVVACEEPKYEMRAGLQSLLNPTLVIEVLSECTAATDRGEKLDCYRTLEPLQTYVLVSQDKPYIQIYRRQEKGWSYTTIGSYTTIKGLEGKITLEAIGCELNSSDIYARIQFAEPHSEESEGEQPDLQPRD